MNLTEIVNKETGFFRKIRRGALYTILSAALSLGAVACKNPGTTIRISTPSLVLNKIAFDLEIDGNSEIYVMNTDKTDQKRLTNNTAFNLDPAWFQDGINQTRLTNNTAFDGFPVWSPDGKKIAFISDRDGNNEIYVMNADGTNQTRLTKNTGNDYSPVWSPYGTKIVFKSNRNGNYEIYVMNADGTNQTRLTNNPAWDAKPIWK